MYINILTQFYRRTNATTLLHTHKLTNMHKRCVRDTDTHGHTRNITEPQMNTCAQIHRVRERDTQTEKDTETETETGTGTGTGTGIGTGTGTGTET